ncbi:MAG: sulfotransferase [Acidobacteriaceae bacterium]
MARLLPGSFLSRGGALTMTSKELIWPNFYVVGAAKSGTTSLYEYLKKHPEVFLPEIKEQNYFSAPPPPGEEIFGIRYCGSLEEYQSLYQQAAGFTAIGDASPSYLWDETACRRIYEVCPQAKIIIILRDPVARAYSHYLFNRMLLIEPEATFWEALQIEARLREIKWYSLRPYASYGLYYAQVRRYFDTFGRDQVLVLFFDDLAKKPKETLAAVAKHIGVDAAHCEALDLSQAHNQYRMPRSRVAYDIAGRLGLRRIIPPKIRWWLNHSPLLFDRNKPTLDEKSRRFLQQVFDPDITRLEELMGGRLPELRKSWS